MLKEGRNLTESEIYVIVKKKKLKCDVFAALP